MLAYARVAHDSDKIEKTDPGLKGHTLQQKAVEPPQTFFTNDSDELFIGQIIFSTMYSVNFVMSLFLSIILLPTVLDRMDHGGNFFEDTVRVQWFIAALLACAYLFAVFVTDLIFLSVYSNSRNIFVVLKILFFFVLTIFVIVTLVYYYCKKAHAKRNTSLIKKIALVGPVWVAIFLLSLSIVPTVLLLCAYPMDTFALIVIHVALIYTETKVGTFVFMQFSVPECTCCRSKDNDIEQAKPNSYSNDQVSLLSKDGKTNSLQKINQPTEEDTQGGRCCPYKPTQECARVCKVLKIGSFGTVIIIMLFVLVGVYFTFIWFYQFILLRSANKNVALDIILKYIPSVVIGLLGFLISKGTSYKHQKMVKKIKKRRASCHF